MSNYRKLAAIALRFRSGPEIKMTITILIYLIIKSQLGLRIPWIHAGECNDIVLYIIDVFLFKNYNC